MPSAAPDRSAAAQAKIPELYLTLGDVYLPATRRYKEGWSDERIAKETGLAVEFVAGRREMDFGPLVADTLRADLEAAVARLAEAQIAVGEASRMQEARLRTAAERLGDLFRLCELAAKRLS